MAETQTVLRDYAGKDVEMTTVIATIVDAALNPDYQPRIEGLNKNMKRPYLLAFRTRITAESDRILGTDAKRTQREATANVEAVFVPAHTAISTAFRVFEASFRDDPDTLATLKKNLGYSRHIKAVQRGDQEALVDLLYDYRTNLDEAIITKLDAAGVTETVYNAPIAFANELFSANTTQEGQKTASTALTADNIRDLNALYNEAMKIAGIGKAAFADDEAVKNLFSYSHLLAGLNRRPASSTTNGSNPQA